MQADQKDLTGTPVPPKESESQKRVHLKDRGFCPPEPVPDLDFQILRLQEAQQGFDTGNLPLQDLFMKILPQFKFKF